MSSVSLSLVEAAARAIRQGWHSACSDTRIAESVLAAVAPMLRLEGAQAERERGQREDAAILAYGEGVRDERARAVAAVEALTRWIDPKELTPHPELPGAFSADAPIYVKREDVLGALRGVHPEASDG